MGRTGSAQGRGAAARGPSHPLSWAACLPDISPPRHLPWSPQLGLTLPPNTLSKSPITSQPPSSQNPPRTPCCPPKYWPQSLMPYTGTSAAEPTCLLIAAFPSWRPPCSQHPALRSARHTPLVPPARALPEPSLKPACTHAHAHTLVYTHLLHTPLAHSALRASPRHFFCFWLFTELWLSSCLSLTQFLARKFGFTHLSLYQ